LVYPNAFHFTEKLPRMSSDFGFEPAGHKQPMQHREPQPVASSYTFFVQPAIRSLEYTPVISRLIVKGAWLTSILGVERQTRQAILKQYFRNNGVYSSF
jgi:hypothetical protein